MQCVMCAGSVFIYNLPCVLMFLMFMCLINTCSFLIYKECMY